MKKIKEEVKNLIILDGGDAFATELKRDEEKTEKIRKRAELVLKIYETIGYDGLNIGDNDLILGVGQRICLDTAPIIYFIEEHRKYPEILRPVFIESERAVCP